MIYPNRKYLTGTVTAVGWDRFNQINKVSLYTHNGKDIILFHKWGIKKFKPFLNQEVKIQGRFLSSLEDERIMEVRRISKFYKNYHSKDENDYDEYSLSDLISVPA